MENKTNVDIIRERYNSIKEKYSLPDFEKMNGDFYIEKINLDETENFEREMRHNISEKFSSYSKLIESILQPSTTQIFIYSLIKKLERKDIEVLNELYKKLSLSELELIELDLIVDKKREGKFVSEAYKLWQEVKEKLHPIIVKLKDSKEVEPVLGSSNYLG